MKLSICLVGACKTGKSHFVSKLKKYPFHKYHSTIGIDFCRHETEKCTFTIWDTSGSDKFKSITNNFVQNVNIIVGMYKDKQSAHWLQEYLNSITYDSIEKIIFIYHHTMYEINTEIENYSIQCTFSEKSVLECLDFIRKVNQKEKDRTYCFW